MMIMQSRRKVDWIYEKPLNDTKSSEDYLTGKAVFDLYKNEKNAMRELEDKKVAGSTFIDDDDISNVFYSFHCFRYSKELMVRVIIQNH